MGQRISAVVGMMGLLLWAAHPSVVLGQPADSANFRLRSQSLNGGLGRSASASFEVSSCLASEPEAGGLSTSASFRLNAGCGAAVAAAVPETPTATPTLTSTSTATHTATATVPPTATHTVLVPVTAEPHANAAARRHHDAHLDHTGDRNGS